MPNSLVIRKLAPMFEEPLTQKAPAGALNKSRDLFDTKFAQYFRRNFVRNWYITVTNHNLLTAF